MSVVASIQRVFEVDGRELVCRFFSPETDGSDFCCRFELDWPEGMSSGTIYGVDEVQALLLAMQTAHAYLLAAREQDGRNISWLGQRRLGLPVADILRDLDVDGGLPPPSQES